MYLDQTDTGEKTRQVRMMKSIYKRAETVVAWLGEETAADRRGVELMKKMFQIIGSRVPEDEILRKGISNYPGSPQMGAPDLPDLPDLGWQDLGGILAKPWFSRVWIMQEYLSAQKFIFICGEAFIDPVILFGLGRHLFKCEMHI